VPAALIVVPCFNEAARFAADRFAAFAAVDPSVSFLFVDDGSSDATLEVLRKLEQQDPSRFSVLALARNQGKAEAVRRGMLAALAQEPRYLGFWDADLATPLDTIPSFVALLEERPDLQMVLGSRVKLMGRLIERKATRHYPGRVLATLCSLVLKLGVYDTQCGAKLFRNTPEVATIFQEPFLAGWLFDVELLARFLSGRRGGGEPPAADAIYEFALHEWRDVPGSKIRPWDFFRALADLVKIHRRYGGDIDNEHRNH
jgi:glycosyltransferase involved in cell wall biosynthesis